ncbi:hypothetical protein [Pontibacter beigongshangensis]|uniref:hypothetical protein n=1 Tax=Pontibacter beigongshangensis TaxID=2574733 RepID=UPI001650CD31|nr:hypothetical protein [Pontibacter beigongshangensis]
MRKILLLLLASSLAVSLTSCDKEEAVSPNIFPSEEQYQTFLSREEPSFSGTMDEKMFNWTYGHRNFEFGGTFVKGTLMCDVGTDRKRGFSLSSSEAGKSFTLHFPSYNYNSTEEIDWVFEVGKKQFGHRTEDFSLVIETDGKYYSSGNDPKANHIEIVKVEKYDEIWHDAEGVPYVNDKKLRMWFKLETLLSSCGSCSEKDSIEVKGLMIVEVPSFEGS